MDIKKPVPKPVRGRPRKTPAVPKPAEQPQLWEITPEIVERILEAEQEE